ncbi:MAG: sensor histidine kinase [Aggregatilineales bacterium]
MLTLPLPTLFLTPTIGIAPHSLVVHSDGTIDYVISTWTLPVFGLGVIMSLFIFRALYHELRNKETGSAFRGWLVAGVLLMVSGSYFPWIPVLKQYTVEQLCYALGCVLLVRPVLQQSLFNPLTELNQLVERRAHALAMVTQVNHRIAASLDLSTLLSAAVGEIWRTFGYTRVCLYLRDSEFLKLNACAGVQATEMQLADKRYRIGDGSTVGRAAATQMATTDENMRYSGSLWNGIRSEANLPLVDESENGGFVIGILSLYSSASDMFSKDELDALRLLAQQLVTAIHNAQLFKEIETARQMASEASEAKTHFLSMMSHDLRTPLQTIAVYSKFMEHSDRYPGTTLSSEYCQDVSKVVQTSQYMKQLVDGILDFAKIEAGEMELRRHAIDPIAILAEIHDTALKLINPGVSFEVGYGTPLPPVYADDTRLREILLNLVSNACKFCETGCISLKVQIAPGSLEFSVADTGPGIPLEYQPSLFNRFKQVRHMARKHAGTGLGLSISKHLVELHNGRIWFESKLGVGTTFFFTIPLASQAQVSLPDNESLPQFYDFGQPTSELPPQAILVVLEHYTLPLSLQNLGYELIYVSAERAIEIATLVEPSLTVIFEAERWPNLADQLRAALSSACVVAEHRSHEPVTVLQNVLVKLSVRIET